MAENGNDEDGGNWGPLITRDEMAIAFNIAEKLGIAKVFGESSPLGGIVVLLNNLVVTVARLEARIQMLETQIEELGEYKKAFNELQKVVGAIQKKIGFTLDDL